MKFQNAPLLIVLAFLTVSSLSFNAEAQELSDDRNTVAHDLLDRYDEEPAAMALGAGGVLELFSTPGGETWTLILTMPDGKVFFIGNGTDWENFPPLKKGTVL